MDKRGRHADFLDGANRDTQLVCRSNLGTLPGSRRKRCANRPMLARVEIPTQYIFGAFLSAKLIEVHARLPGFDVLRFRIPFPPPTVSSLTLSSAMWRGENRHVLRDFLTGPLDCSIDNYRPRPSLWAVLLSTLQVPHPCNLKPELGQKSDSRSASLLGVVHRRLVTARQ
jgi:hypothetical protein